MGIIFILEISILPIVYFQQSVSSGSGVVEIAKACYKLVLAGVLFLVILSITFGITIDKWASAKAFFFAQSEKAKNLATQIQKAERERIKKEEERVWISEHMKNPILS